MGVPYMCYGTCGPCYAHTQACTRICNTHEFSFMNSTFFYGGNRNHALGLSVSSFLPNLTTRNNLYLPFLIRKKIRFDCFLISITCELRSIPVSTFHPLLDSCIFFLKIIFSTLNVCPIFFTFYFRIILAHTFHFQTTLGKEFQIKTCCLFCDGIHLNKY